MMNRTTGRFLNGVWCLNSVWARAQPPQQVPHLQHFSFFSRFFFCFLFSCLSSSPSPTRCGLFNNISVKKKNNNNLDFFSFFGKRGATCIMLSFFFFKVITVVNVCKIVNQWSFFPQALGIYDDSIFFHPSPPNNNSGFFVVLQK